VESSRAPCMRMDDGYLTVPDQVVR
jgi:hypothetical protein